MASKESLDDFVTGRRWAVVGASNDRSKFGNITFRELQRRGLAATADAQIARYNPPFMPAFLRRNEVLIPVRRTQ